MVFVFRQNRNRVKRKWKKNKYDSYYHLKAHICRFGEERRDKINQLITMNWIFVFFLEYKLKKIESTKCVLMNLFLSVLSRSHCTGWGYADERQTRQNLSSKTKNKWYNRLSFSYQFLQFIYKYFVQFPYHNS